LRSDLWLLIIRLREEISTRSCIGWRIWGSGATGRRWSWSILRRCGLGRYLEERKVQIRGELLGNNRCYTTVDVQRASLWPKK